LCKHPRINLFAHNYHGRKASDLAPRTREDIHLFLLEQERLARHRRRSARY
jgi:hypothetical protein